MESLRLRPTFPNPDLIMVLIFPRNGILSQPISNYLISTSLVICLIDPCNPTEESNLAVIAQFLSSATYSCILLPRKVFDLLLLRAPFYLLHWMLPDLNWFFSNKLLNFFVCLSLSSNSSVVRRRNWWRPWRSPGATSNQVKVLIEPLELTAFLLLLGVIPLGSYLCNFCVRSFQTFSELFFFFFLFSSDQIWIPARVRLEKLGLQRWTWKTRLGSRLDRVSLGNWSGSR